MARRSPHLVALAAGAVLLAAAAAQLWPCAFGVSQRCPQAEARADTLDDRVYAVARQLMCPVCAGQTVAESDSAVAREMRDVIRAKLQAGETPAAILNFFVGQFGEGVLAEPPRRGLSLLLYLGPAAGAAGGLAIAVLLIRRWTGRAGVDAARPVDLGPDAGAEGHRLRPPGAADEAALARLARELEARDRF